MNKLKNNICVLIATGFFSGKLPFSPGTWGSLAFVLLWYILGSFGLLQSLEEQSLCVFVLAALGHWSTHNYLKINSPTSNQKSELDPPSVVIDEWLGMMIALLGVRHNDTALIICAFLAFRFFDILKPGPIRKAEKQPGAIGIMLDDALAGLIATVVVQTLARWI